MLKFLDKKHNLITSKSPKKYKPGMTYGISYESPK
jgi:hypothetical protein